MTGTSDALHLRQLRQAILPILVIDPGGKLHAIGTCFIVSCTGKEALAITAQHNIQYIMHLDGKRPLSCPSAPIQFRLYERHSGPKNVWMFVALMSHDGKTIPCDLVKSWYWEDGPDIAAVLLRIPEKYGEVFKSRMPIRSRGPLPGERVSVFGYCDSEFSSEERDVDGVIFKQCWSNPLKQIPSTVGRVFAFGERHLVKFPCFEFDQTPDAGMSGGPVAINSNGILVACGVVATGSSYEKQGVASILYPALPIRLDANFPFLQTTTPALLDCIQFGMIEDQSDAHKHVLANGQWTDAALARVCLDRSNLHTGIEGYMYDSKSVTDLTEFKWLSEECLHLGQINQHNGDDSDYLLISAEFREAFNRDEASQKRARLRFVRATTPYVWLGVGNDVFRFFVLALPSQDAATPRVKVLTDSRREQSNESASAT